MSILRITKIEGFPLANISEHVIAPALEITRSAAAYAKSMESKNLDSFSRKFQSL